MRARRWPRSPRGWRCASGRSNRYRELRNLGELVIGMVHDTLDAFARFDTDLALQVLRRDRTVDEEYEAIHRQSITFMMEDPRSIRRALDVMWVVRSLERIGDHAKNICEYLIYLVHGQGRAPHQDRRDREGAACRPRA